jgi:hypothetical protein
MVGNIKFDPLELHTKALLHVLRVRRTWPKHPMFVILIWKNSYVIQAIASAAEMRPPSRVEWQKRVAK